MIKPIPAYGGDFVLVGSLLKANLQTVLQPIQGYPSHTLPLRKEYTMNKIFARFVFLTQKVNRQHVQIAFAALALVLMVLGAGAPEDGGHVGIGR